MGSTQRHQSKQKITIGVAKQAVIFYYGLTAIFPNTSLMSLLLLPLPMRTAELSVKNWDEATHHFDNYGYLQFEKEADFESSSNSNEFSTHLSCSSNITLSKSECSYCLDFVHFPTGELHLYRVQLLRELTNYDSTLFKSKGCKIQIENAGNLTIEDGAFHGLEDIVSLRIAHNNIKYLGKPQAVFSGLTDLHILNLSYNNILEWNTDNDNIGDKEDVYKTNILPNLQMLILNGNHLSHLSNNSLLWLQNSSITHLSLRNCEINSFHIGFLYPIASTLRVLELGGVPIFTKNLYGLLVRALKLEGLGLAKMGISDIPSRILQRFSSSLQYLSLHGNLLHSISSLENVRRHTFNTGMQQRKSTAFPFMENLEEMDLRSCSIYFIEENAFDAIPKLRVLLISKNFLLSFHLLQSFHAHRNLFYLDLSYNLLDLQEGNISHLPALETLNLSNTNFNINSFFVANNKSNLKSLYLNYAGLRSIERASLQKLSTLEILSLEGNKKLGKNLHGNDFCDLVNLKELNLAHCSFVPKPEVFQCLKSLRSLNLMYNGITYLSNTTFQHLPLLESLNLNHNMLKTWNEPIFSFNSNLKYLNAAHNHITHLSDAMFSDFSNVKVLVISFNPFICDCYVSRFLQLMQNKSLNNSTYHPKLYFQNQYITPQERPTVKHSKNRFFPFAENTNALNYLGNQQINEQMFVEHWNETEEYLCSFVHDTATDNISITTYNFKDVPQDLCDLNKHLDGNDQDNSHLENNEIQEKENKTYNILVAFIVMGTTILVLLVIMYWKWQYVKYYAILIKNSNIFRLMTPDSSEGTNSVEKIYNYNVFVSYSDQNREWILKELLPNLESKSDIIICLHERDFQVGAGIVENIVSNMDNSKCVLLVISQQFLDSRWCQFELELAQYRLLEAKHKELILVFLEEIPKQSRPKSLSYLMKTKTYIVWPENGKEAERKCFWNRLHHAVLQYSVINNGSKCMSLA